MTQPEANRFPDFFLVGAPRCGTTALSRYLARNPQVCFSRPKEPHYFARTMQIPTADELKRDYLDRCYGHCTPKNRALGEGSVSYLLAPGAIENILHFNPKAKFIVQVRNPLKMLPSYHLRMQFLLQEDQTDFATAWQDSSQDMRATRSGHLGAPARMAAAVPFDSGGAEAPNGNSVSLEKEMVKSVEARQEHEMALAIYRATSDVIRASLGRPR